MPSRPFVAPWPDYLVLTAPRAALLQAGNEWLPRRWAMALPAAHSRYRLLVHTATLVILGCTLPTPTLARVLCCRLTHAHPALTLSWWRARQTDRSFVPIESYQHGRRVARSEDSLLWLLGLYPSAAANSPWHWRPAPAPETQAVTVALPTTEACYVQDLLQEAAEGVLHQQSRPLWLAAQASASLSSAGQAWFWQQLRQLAGQSAPVCAPA